MIMKELKENLRIFTKDQGMDLFGVADLTEARTFIQIQGGEHMSQYPRAISIGMRLLDAIIDELFLLSLVRLLGLLPILLWDHILG